MSETPLAESRGGDVGGQRSGWAPEHTGSRCGNVFQRKTFACDFTGLVTLRVNGFGPSLSSMVRRLRCSTRQLVGAMALSLSQKV